MWLNAPAIMMYLGPVAALIGALYGSFRAIVAWTPQRLRLATALSAIYHLALLAAVATLGYGFFHMDDPGQYDRVAVSVASQWRRGVVPNITQEYSIGSFGYYYWVAAIYRVIGHYPLIAQSANVVFAILMALMVYRITLRLGGSALAVKTAAVAALFYPTLAIWSVMLLKDAVAILLFLIALELILISSERPSLWPWATLAATGFVLSTIRFYYGIMALGLGMMMPLALRSRPTGRVVRGMALLVLALYASFRVGEGPWYIEVVQKPELVPYLISRLSGGGSSFGGHAAQVAARIVATLAVDEPAQKPISPSQSSGPTEASTPQSSQLSNVPKFRQPPLVIHSGDAPALWARVAALDPNATPAWKVARFFLVPLPSQKGTKLLDVAKLDWLFWWPLVVLTLAGVKRGFALSWQRTLIIAAPALLLVVFYSMMIGNAGTLVRYRSELFPLFIVVGGLGLDEFFEITRARGQVSWRRSV